MTKEDISADIFSAVGEVYWLFQCRNKPTSFVCFGLLEVSNIWTHQTEASLCDLLNAGVKRGTPIQCLEVVFQSQLHVFI